jgi:hypothetical protein
MWACCSWVSSAHRCWVASMTRWVSLRLLVVAHFFLFCNVLRLSRSLELLWAVSFTALAASTFLLGLPSWNLTVLLTLCVTAAVSAVHVVRPSYHGVFWKLPQPESAAVAGAPSRYQSMMFPRLPVAVRPNPRIGTPPSKQEKRRRVLVNAGIGFSRISGIWSEPLRVRMMPHKQREGSVPSFESGRAMKRRAARYGR